MRSTVYIETSVVSYLISLSSRDLITAGHQQITQQWWTSRLPAFKVYISELVVREAGGGDEVAAQKRLEAIRNFPILELKMELITS